MLISTGIIGRPKKKSKRRVKVVSCKIRAIKSSTSVRLNCRLGYSEVSLVSLSWPGLVNRIKYDCERRLNFLGPDRLWRAVFRPCGSDNIVFFLIDRIAFTLFSWLHSIAMFLAGRVVVDVFSWWYSFFFLLL